MTYSPRGETLDFSIFLHTNVTTKVFPVIHWFINSMLILTMNIEQILPVFVIKLWLVVDKTIFDDSLVNKAVGYCE